METLEYFYEQDFSKIAPLHRKIEISSQKTIIYGAPKSGKSYVVYSYLKSQKKGSCLYVDMQDPRVKPKALRAELEPFLKAKKIETLALDNFDFSFPLPNIKNIILTSESKRELDGFESLFMGGLDFEEFLGFEKKFSNITNSFNTYLKQGTLPELTFLPEHLQTKRLQEIARLIAQNGTIFEIFRLLCSNISKKQTPFWLYNQLKEEIKVSKDTFYKTVDELKSKHIIYQIPKLHDLNAPKKIYLYEFGYKGALGLEKDFSSILENMIFLEILSKNVNATIEYGEQVEFFVNRGEALVKLPFGNEENLGQKLKKIATELASKGIKKCTIITLGYEGRGAMDGLEYECMPFWSWAVG